MEVYWLYPYLGWCKGRRRLERPSVSFRARCRLHLSGYPLPWSTGDLPYRLCSILSLLFNRLTFWTLHNLPGAPFVPACEPALSWYWHCLPLCSSFTLGHLDLLIDLLSYYWFCTRLTVIVGFLWLCTEFFYRGELPFDLLARSHRACAQFCWWSHFTFLQLPLCLTATPCIHLSRAKTQACTTTATSMQRRAARRKRANARRLWYLHKTKMFPLPSWKLPSIRHTLQAHHSKDQTFLARISYAMEPAVVEPWKCAPCKKICSGSHAYCGSCGQEWRNCYDPHFVSPKITAKDERNGTTIKSDGTSKSKWIPHNGFNLRAEGNRQDRGPNVQMERTLSPKERAKASQ